MEKKRRRSPQEKDQPLQDLSALPEVKPKALRPEGANGGLDGRGPIPLCPSQASCFAFLAIIASRVSKRPFISLAKSLLTSCAAV